MKITFKNHLIICHFPGIQQILQLVRELRAHPDNTAKRIVLVTDVLEELPDELAAEDIQFVKGSPARENVLVKANIKSCEGAFVLAQDPSNPNTDAQTFAVGAIIEMIEKEIKRPIKVIVELVSKSNLRMMQRAQTDGIVMHEGITDCLLVQEYLHPGIHGIFQQIIRNADGSQFYIFDTKLQGFTIRDIQKAVLDNPSNLQIVGVINNGKHMLNPPKDTCIGTDDKLIMLAENKKDFNQVECGMLKGK